MSCILFVYFVLNTYTVKQSQPWDDPTCNTNDAHKYTVHIHGTHTPARELHAPISPHITPCH